MMVTGEATYERVAEVAEIAPDDYVLKPFTPAQMEQRLRRASARKEAMLPIFDLIDLSQLSEACALAIEKSKADTPYRLNFLRLAAELLIKLDRVEEAKNIYESLEKVRAMPWSRLGMALIDIRQGNSTKASRTLELLISEYPQYLDAYDALGKLHLSQGSAEKAMAVFRDAVDISPNNIPRLQRLGLLSFIEQDYEAAEKAFDRVVRIGFLSKDFDYRSVLLSLYVKTQLGQTREVQRLYGLMLSVSQKFPESYRIGKMLKLCEAMAAVSRENYTAARDICTELLSEVLSPKFDFELACDLLFLLSRLTNVVIDIYPAQQYTRTIANRFTVSQLGTNVLKSSCRGLKYLEDIVMEVYDEGLQLSRKSIQRLLKNEHMEVTTELLNIANRTLNAKYILMLFNLAKKLEENPSYLDLAIEVRNTGIKIKEEYCSYGSKLLNLEY
jgi:tetratricopeptide (TPR) repeat protein